MIENKEKLLVEVSKMYYYYGYSQKKIAETISLSKAYVCQLLDTAKREGIVEIKVHDCYANDEENESWLKEEFGLKGVRIFQNHTFLTREKMIQAMADAVGEVLKDTVKSESTLAFSWGNTLNSISKELNFETSAKDVQVIPLSGSMNNIQKNIYVAEISTKLAQLFHGTPYIIPLPALVENKEIKQLLYSDRTIGSLFHKLDNADVAVFTVGNPGEDNAVFRSGFINKNDLKNLKQKGLVGDFCVHFLDRDGEICDPEFDERTVSASLEAIKRIPVKICIVFDASKAPILRSVLKKNYVDYLFADEATIHLMKNIQ